MTNWEDSTWEETKFWEEAKREKYKTKNYFGRHFSMATQAFQDARYAVSFHASCIHWKTSSPVMYVALRERCLTRYGPVACAFLTWILSPSTYGNMGFDRAGMTRTYKLWITRHDMWEDEPDVRYAECSVFVPGGGSPICEFKFPGIWPHSVPVIKIATPANLGFLTDGTRGGWPSTRAQVVATNRPTYVDPVTWACSYFESVVTSEMLESNALRTTEIFEDPEDVESEFGSPFSQSSMSSTSESLDLTVAHPSQNNPSQASTQENDTVRVPPIEPDTNACSPWVYDTPPERQAEYPKPPTNETIRAYLNNPRDQGGMLRIRPSTLERTTKRKYEAIEID